MKPYEYMRYYHPRLGRFVFKHKGSGIIVDNIFKPIQSAMSTVAKKFVKPFGNKVLKSGISNAGKQVEKKLLEKSGDLIMKRLHNMRPKAIEPIKNNKQKTTKLREKKRQDNTDMIINRLISGN